MWRILFCEGTLQANSKNIEDGIINMLEVLVESLFVVFAERFFQQIVGIAIGKNFVPLLDGIFCTHTKRIRTVLALDLREPASQFNFTYKHIDYI